jgi:TolB protein
MNVLRPISTLATLVLATACSASPAPTSTLSTQPTPTPAPTQTAPASQTPVETAAPTPSATTSPIDGVYKTSFTKEALSSSPLLYGQSEVNDDNWGDWTFTFGAGRMSDIQKNPVVTTTSSGTFSVSGDAVTLAFDTGDNQGETFALRWTLSGSTLSFTRDESLGAGPTPFLVKAWRRADATTGDPLVCCGAKLFPGTYAPKLDPPITFTLDHEVDLDCVPGYRCRGDVNVDEPDWLDLEFGNVHGSELMVFGLDKLPDPARPGKFIDPPDDFGAWIASFKGVSIVDSAHDVLVGGVQAVQLDIDTGHEAASFGPSDSTVRLIALRVAGREVVIQETLGPENTTGDFDAAVGGLQAVIDSITWGTPGPTGQIVFEDVGNNFVGTQIWIENADGSDVRQLVTDDFTDGGASLSPDGTRVVFYRSGELTGQVMLVNADGSGLRQFDTGGPAQLCDDGPEGDAWSPDGTHIAFTRVCLDESGAVRSGGDIWTIKLDGSAARQLTHHVPSDMIEDHRASWSPDGKWLVFARIDTSVPPEKSALFTVSADGGDAFQVTPWELDANDPDWSPDGALIAFNSPADSGGDQNIWVTKPDGSGVTQLTSDLSTYTDGGQATYHPTWSPDGLQILFSHAPSTGSFADLFVMNRDGSGLHVLALTELQENHATWGGR